MEVTLPTLYDHQADQRDRLRKSLARHGRVIACAPPGTGKTRLAKWILGAGLNRTHNEKQSGRSLFAVHRRGLVDNATSSFQEDPALPFGVIMSQRESAYGYRLQVASIDSLLSWFIEANEWKLDITFDLVVFDETHSHLGKLRTMLDAHDRKRTELGMMPALVIGLSATPRCKGLADVYKEIVPGPTTEWLIENKFLSPFRYIGATKGKLEKLVMRGGDFTKDSECEAMAGMAGDLVRDWKQHAEGRPTVGFFPRLDQAEQAQEILKEAGINAAYLDGSTKDEERRSLFRALNNGSLQYLCNVGVIERGTDIPRIGCVQLCVAIGSVVRYRQMIGRGSRVHPAKTDCLVLDHGGNVKRLGYFEDDIQWTLDRSTDKTKDAAARPTIECPQCNAIYRGGKCRQCGYEPTKGERKSQGLDFDGSQLVEYTRKKQKSTGVKTPEQIMISAIYQAAARNGTWRQAMAIAFGDASKCGCIGFKIPKSFEVGGKKYYAVPWGSIDASRRVKDLYPFTDRS